MKRRVSKFLILFSCIFVLTGCGDSKQAKLEAQQKAFKAAQEYEAKESFAMSNGSGATVDASDGIADDNSDEVDDSSNMIENAEATTYNKKQDKLVYTYDVNYTVDAVYKTKAIQNIDELIKKTDCYVASSYQSDSEYQLTIRVANDKKDDFVSDMLDGLKYESYSLNKQVDNKTDEYYDLQKSYDIEEENYKAYSRLLDKADNVNDVLTITNHLNEAKGQMDYYKGLMNGIDDDVAYSTLNVVVRFSNTTTAMNTKIPFGWEIGDAFSDGFNIFLDLIKGIILFVVHYIFIILALIIIILVVRKYKKKHPVREDKRYSYQDKVATTTIETIHEEKENNEK